MTASNCVDSGRSRHSLDNERGVALVLVLMMLLLLSILGVTMLASSTSELKIAGNYRNNEEAFYVADAALDYGMSFSDIYTSIIPGSSTSWPESGQGMYLDENTLKVTTTPNTGNANFNRLIIKRPNGSKLEADVKVDFIATGNVPVGSGSQEDAGLGQGTGFKANSFAVNVIAYGPNNSQAQLESQVARIVPQQ
jgi:Tfp pilus assembly protein PilX